MRNAMKSKVSEKTTYKKRKAFAYRYITTIQTNVHVREIDLGYLIREFNFFFESIHTL